MGCHFIIEKDNKRKAVYWLDKAAQKDFVEAQSFLGWIFRADKDVKKDLPKAKYWLSKAADQGNAEAQYNLGILYYYTEINDENENNAIKWFHSAADQGHTEAQIFLSTMYILGEGVKQNFEKACFWNTLAMKIGINDTIIEKQSKELQEIIENTLNSSRVSSVKTKVQNWLEEKGLNLLIK